jgi:predicted amidophosphoribosyltransferase
MVVVHPQKITGNWRFGVALDFHTTSSTPIGYNEYGHMQFDTVRPEIAELLFQLKYRGDQSVAPQIIETAASFLRQGKFDIIVPVPPSSSRRIQPVLLLANGIGAALNVPVVQCITATRPTAQLKGVTDPEERKVLLDGLFAVDPRRTANKSILLFDDLFRSGATMNAITDVLLKEGQAVRVDVLTITRTRSNK